MEEFIKEVFWKVKDLYRYENFYDSGVTQNDHFHSTYELVKNLSYSTQYLEYINNSLSFELHSVIRVELIKSFVVVGIGIVESILYYFIKSNNLQWLNHYEEITTITANDKKVGEEYLRLETKLLKRLDIPVEEDMNLDSMLKKAEKNKIIGNDQSLYRQLNRLRKLRNKVHLHLVEEHLDTDWNNFTTKELNMIKQILQKLFYSKIFDCEMEMKKNLFDFLTIQTTNNCK